jgi:hypothetical protein
MQKLECEVVAGLCNLAAMSNHLPGTGENAVFLAVEVRCINISLHQYKERLEVTRLPRCSRRSEIAP